MRHIVVHVWPQPSHNLGGLTIKCKHCSSLHFEREITTRENFSLCCGNEKISFHGKFCIMKYSNYIPVKMKSVSWVRSFEKLNIKILPDKKKDTDRT